MNDRRSFIVDADKVNRLDTPAKSRGAPFQPAQCGNLVSGRQLRAARVLAGLTQAQLAEAVGCHERACRYWEAKGDNLPTSTTAFLRKIEAALLVKGVAIFRKPSPGARIVTTNSDFQKLPTNDN
jgi:DNA-binding XRE family transcriptional regulator